MAPRSTGIPTGKGTAGAGTLEADRCGTNGGFTSLFFVFRDLGFVFFASFA
jgi:hypothetical protein